MADTWTLLDTLTDATVWHSHYTQQTQGLQVQLDYNPQPSLATFCMFGYSFKKNINRVHFRGSIRGCRPKAEGYVQDTSLTRGTWDPLYPAGKASAWVEPRKCAEGKARGTFEASQKHWPFPRGINGRTSLLAGMYLIYTMIRLFWPWAFTRAGISDPLSPMNTAIQLVR